MFFLIISVIIFNTVAILINKRLKKNELYAIAMFSLVLGLVTDITLDLKYNFYGYFDKGVQLTGFIPILGLFPSAGIIYMNFFPYNKSLVVKIFFTLVSTGLCLMYEFFAILSGFFYHNEWKYWLSALTYPFLFWLHLIHLNLYRRYTNSNN